MGDDYKTTTGEYKRDFLGKVIVDSPLPPAAGYSYIGATAADGILFFFWVKDTAKKETSK